MSYFALMKSHEAMTDTQYYFRRFPFKGLPVSHEQHLRYICEMFFSRIYEFRERLKRSLNAINIVIETDLAIKQVLKSFSKEFDQDLRERNSIHHFSHFEDAIIGNYILDVPNGLAH